MAAGGVISLRMKEWSSCGVEAPEFALEADLEVWPEESEDGSGEAVR